MSLYNLILVVLGVAILGVAWLPSLLKKYPLSYPILFVGLGMLLFALPLGLPDPDPVEFSHLCHSPHRNLRDGGPHRHRPQN